MTRKNIFKKGKIKEQVIKARSVPDSSSPMSVPFDRGAGLYG